VRQTIAHKRVTTRVRTQPLLASGSARHADVPKTDLL